MHQPVHRNRKSKYSQEKKEAEFKENNVKYCIHKAYNNLQTVQV